MWRMIARVKTARSSSLQTAERQECIGGGFGGISVVEVVVLVVVVSTGELVMLRWRSRGCSSVVRERLWCERWRVASW